MKPATQLSEVELDSIVSLYQLDGTSLVSHEHYDRRASAYLLSVDDRRLTLRFLAGRTFNDMLFERDVVSEAAEGGVPVVEPLTNIAGGTFTPWGGRGRYASLYEDPVGRRVGAFEIQPGHAGAVGALCGRLHALASNVGRRREHPQALFWMEKTLRRAEASLEKKRLAKRFADHVAELRRAIDRQHARWPSGPVGLSHNRWSIDAVWFEGQSLTAVQDFRDAVTDRHTCDLAIAMHVWAWIPSPHQTGGPSGGFDAARIQAMLGGYRETHPNVDERALLADLELTAIRLALHRLAEHELRHDKAEGVPYRDYRHYLARLWAVRDLEL